MRHTNVESSRIARESNSAALVSLLSSSSPPSLQLCSDSESCLPRRCPMATNRNVATKKHAPMMTMPELPAQPPAAVRHEIGTAS
eukprot:6212189-Pleurochrysis_carterae.AAC.3